MNTYSQKNAVMQRQFVRSKGLTQQSDSSYITVYHPSQLWQLLSHWGQHLVNWLTSGTLPRVTQIAQAGTTVWKVYDPITHRTQYFDHEEAVRIWLEGRYYQ